jgi:hypothetical protein
MVGLMVVGLLMSGAAADLFTGNGPGNGKGNGGPAKSDADRAARQAAGLEKNGGICPNGGPRANCPGLGQGKGKGQGLGQGKVQRRGACDGTGPRAGTANCPANGQARK